MITQPTEEYFKDGGWGWDGTRWRKLAVVWGYSDTYAALGSGTASNGGDVTVNLANIPSGYVAKVESILAYHDDPAARGISLYLMIDGVGYTLKNELAVAQYAGVPVPVSVSLGPGDNVRATGFALANGRSLYLFAVGYLMAVT